MVNSKSLPTISIVTPSFNMHRGIKLCCASVADQGIEVEHVIMDGGSTDGTKEWLGTQENLAWVSEPDRGMYNALNKAIAKATGEIIGHLNCDEQYLPGTLSFVADFFKQHPEVDFIAADFLVVDPSGNFVAYRKSFKPRWPYFFSNYLYTNTCTLFYRRKIFRDCGFDESYRSIADVIFVSNVLRKGYRGVHVKRYFATFTFSGANLSLNPISAIEKKRFFKTLPIWYKLVWPFFFICFFIEKIMNGTYQEATPLSYAIFEEKNLITRKSFSVKNPTFRLRFKLPSTL